MFGTVRGADVTVKYGHFFSLLLTNIQKFNELSPYLIMRKVLVIVT